MLQRDLHSAKASVSLQIRYQNSTGFVKYYQKNVKPPIDTDWQSQSHLWSWWHGNWPGLISSRRVLWFSLRCSDCRFTSLTVNTLGFSLGIIPENSKCQGYLQVSLPGNCPILHRSTSWNAISILVQIAV